jgi:hypothetical protein
MPWRLEAGFHGRSDAVKLPNWRRFIDPNGIVRRHNLGPDWRTAWKRENPLPQNATPTAPSS